MSDDFQLTITGLDDVLSTLTRLPERIVKKAYAKALTAAAVPIVRALDARTLEFKDATGELRENLVSDVAINSQGKGGTLKVGFGRMGHVARFLEFGHREIGHAPLHKELGNVQPHPFMRPALETAADDALQAFADSLKSSIDEGAI